VSDLRSRRLPYSLGRRCWRLYRVCGRSSVTGGFWVHSSRSIALCRAALDRAASDCVMPRWTTPRR